jgi:phage/plasmid primase-like uncharacterized protein
MQGTFEIVAYRELSLMGAEKPCPICGERPHFSENGHRGHGEMKLFHDCQKLSGSPNVLFTEEQWNEGPRFYHE